MEFFYSSALGALHSISATIALLFGALVLIKEKGTKKHKVYGYIYFTTMLTLNVSAIPLQNLFGGFGWFHLFILMSLPYVLIGIYFPVFGRHHERWQVWHFELMAYSYLGLFAAFIAEVFIRVPLLAAASSLNIFVIGVFLVAGIVGVIGHRIICGYKQKKFS